MYGGLEVYNLYSTTSFNWNSHQEKNRYSDLSLNVNTTIKYFNKIQIYNMYIIYLLYNIHANVHTNFVKF